MRYMDFFLGLVEYFYDIPLERLAERDNTVCFLDPVAQKEMVPVACQTPLEMFVGVEIRNKVREKHDAFPERKNRRIRVREEHDIGLLFAERVPKQQLIGKGSDLGIDLDGSEEC